eukprot:3233093-Rhodomonas_salina.1
MHCGDADDVSARLELAARSDPAQHPQRRRSGMLEGRGVNGLRRKRHKDGARNRCARDRKKGGKQRESERAREGVRGRESEGARRGRERRGRMADKGGVRAARSG